MKRPRILIFDVYHTLLTLGGPAPDAEARWQRLLAHLLGEEPTKWAGRLSLAQFEGLCRDEVSRSHFKSRALGIDYPEVVWPEILGAALPPLLKLDAKKLYRFAREQMQLLRSTALAPGAGAFLHAAIRDGMGLGIASNAQAYTLDELGDALGSAGLGMDIFDPTLCAWSFENGFSKPNPHVFAPLSAKLSGRGIAPDEICMIGDRLDNDIEPARAFGWQTWQIPRAEETGVRVGGWDEARCALLEAASTP